MDRRALLSLSGTVAAAVLAGCLTGGGTSPRTDTPTDAGTETPANALTGTPSETPATRTDTPTQTGTPTETPSETLTETPAEGSDVDLAVVVAGPDGERRFFEGEDVSRVGDVEAGAQGGYVLPVELDEGAVADATEAFDAVGAANAPRASSFVVRIDGDEQTFGVGPALATEIGSGEWAGDFRFVFDDSERAESVRDALRT